MIIEIHTPEIWTILEAIIYLNYTAIFNLELKVNRNYISSSSLRFAIGLCRNFGPSFPPPRMQITLPKTMLLSKMAEIHRQLTKVDCGEGWKNIIDIVMGKCPSYLRLGVLNQNHI